MRITACSNCGSLDLGWVGGGAKAIFDFTGASALSGIVHCAKCGKDLLPIEFDSKEAYLEFAKSLKRMKARKRVLKQEARK